MSIIKIFILEAILFQGELSKFAFNEYQPYAQRYIVVTKNAVRIYENKKKALITYGKPIIAVPLAAISKVERIKFDLRDDGRMDEGIIDKKTTHLNTNMFELFLQDEFLPIYSH